jgi:3-keto-disaccharide hydrolase
VKRQVLIAAILVMVVALAAFATHEGNASGETYQSKPSGKWIELFNGKDLTGWKHIGKGSFIVEDGALVSQAGMGLLYYEAQSFKDYTLEVEWKVMNKCNNSGIFVRFPEKSDDPWHAVTKGYEIQIDDCDKNGLKVQTGSAYDQFAATKIASKPAGEWNKYEITIVGQHYTVVLNGEKVNEFDGSRGAEGYIGLQNHDPISKVSFRRVRVKEMK